MSFKVVMSGWEELPKDVKKDELEACYFCDKEKVCSFKRDDIKDCVERSNVAEYASWLLIYHNGKLIQRESDEMCPEDTRFFRSLDWVAPLIEKAYEVGMLDGVTDNF